MPSRIESIRPKINRANEHVHDLEIALQSFHGSNPYQADFQDDPSTGQRTYYATGIRDLPSEIILIAGDALQNFRTSLDYLAYQLVLSAGGTPTRRTSFPISESAERYRAECPGKIDGMRDEAKNAIHALKPYKGGNEPLWQLHALNNVDKHRLLLTCATGYLARTVAASEEEMTTFTVSFPTKFVPLEKGKVFHRVPLSEDHPNAQFHGQVALNEPGIVEGESLLETVRTVAYAVHHLVTSFTPFLV